jgi:hypothetical protein
VEPHPSPSSGSGGGVQHPAAVPGLCHLARPMAPPPIGGAAAGVLQPAQDSCEAGYQQQHGPDHTMEQQQWRRGGEQQGWIPQPGAEWGWAQSRQQHWHVELAGNL